MSSDPHWWKDGGAGMGECHGGGWPIGGQNPSFVLKTFIVSVSDLCILLFGSVVWLWSLGRVLTQSSVAEAVVN